MGVYCFIEREQMGHARDEEGCLSVVSPSAPGEEEEAGKQPSTSCQHQCWQSQILPGFLPRGYLEGLLAAPCEEILSKSNQTSMPHTSFIPPYLPPSPSLALSGDIHPNPGPTKRLKCPKIKYPCSVCSRNVTSSSGGYKCNACLLCTLRLNCLIWILIAHTLIFAWKFVKSFLMMLFLKQL